ncbi:MAG TPA: glycosyltransferase [Nocardioidaceae bacterium]|nr:glycosyltransferase [Nocardioidaceae bacterium]
MLLPHHVVAVVVTWNRCDLLAECLRAVQGQTSPPERIIVVDNASDDGTADLLRDDFGDVDVVRTSTNLGGAGGFALGLSEALRQDCAAVWLLDDDTIPRPTALAELRSARQGYGYPPSLVASRAIWTDGRDHPMNTPRPKPGARRREEAAARAVGCIPIRSASFVSVLIDAATARQRGLPVADYFLWNDDFEFTTRLIRGRRGLYCPASVVVHKTASFGATLDPGDRFFYEVRNKVWLFTRSPGLGAGEKVLYGGSTLRRWAQTFRLSRDRRALARGLSAGIRAGLWTAPRETADVLSGAIERPSGAAIGWESGGTPADVTERRSGDG